MRYLKPKPMPILIGEKVYSVLFTLDVIDRLQSDTGMPIAEILEWACNEKNKEIAVKCLLKYLIGIDVEIDNINYLATMLITAFIEQARCKEIQGHTPQVSGKADFIDIERWVYIGKTILEYPEKEVWEMTLGKIGTLYREHLKYTGAIKVEEEVSLLSI